MPAARWVHENGPHVGAFLYVPKEQNVVSTWASEHQSHKVVVGRIYWTLSGVAVSALSLRFEGEPTPPSRNEGEIELWMAENGTSEALVQR